MAAAATQASLPSASPRCGASVLPHPASSPYPRRMYGCGSADPAPLCLYGVLAAGRGAEGASSFGIPQSNPALFVRPYESRHMLEDSTAMREPYGSILSNSSMSSGVFSTLFSSKSSLEIYYGYLQKIPVRVYPDVGFFLLLIPPIAFLLPRRFGGSLLRSTYTYGRAIYGYIRPHP